MALFKIYFPSKADIFEQENTLWNRNEEDKKYEKLIGGILGDRKMYYKENSEEIDETKVNKALTNWIINTLTGFWILDFGLRNALLGMGYVNPSVAIIFQIGITLLKPDFTYVSSRNHREHIQRTKISPSAFSLYTSNHRSLKFLRLAIRKNGHFLSN